MKGHLKEITKSKTGKSWRVLVDDRWFGAKFDSKLDSIPIGSAIDFQFDPDPKYGDWITTWGPDTAAPVTAGPLAAVVIERPPVWKPAVERWWLPFVSNQCAHAIAAGHIKGVQDLRSWAIAARSAINAADGEDVPY